MHSYGRITIGLLALLGAGLGAGNAGAQSQIGRNNKLPILGTGTGTGVAGTGDTVAVLLGSRTVLEYRQTPNANKVYVAKLYSPAGVQVLLDSPPDHVHHHGLMYALDVEGVSFWMDGPKEGVQQPRGPAAGAAKGVLEQTLDWTTADGRKVLEEQRRITATEVKELSATLLTWTSRLAVPAGNPPVPLTTSRTYVGLGLRFPKSMDRAARFLFQDGKDSTPVRNTEKVTRDRWCACIGPVDGKTVTVAMFSHPGNYRHPASWFTMSDSLTYMTATLNLFRQPLVLKEKQPLELSYGVAVWDGEAKAGVIESLYQRWQAVTPAPQGLKEP